MAARVCPSSFLAQPSTVHLDVWMRVSGLNSDGPRRSEAPPRLNVDRCFSKGEGACFIQKMDVIGAAQLMFPFGAFISQRQDRSELLNHLCDIFFRIYEYSDVSGSSPYPLIFVDIIEMCTFLGLIIGVSGK